MCKTIKYVEAMKKIDDLLKKIESEPDVLDVDNMIEDIEEAANLIVYCRKKLFQTEAKIEKVFERLEKETENL